MKQRAWAGAGVMIAALFGCDDPSQSGATTSAASPHASEAPLRLGVQLDWMPEPEFGGLYAAKELGLFAAAGLAVSIVPGAPGVPVAQMVASGTCEIGVLSCDQILTTRAQGGDIVGVYATFATNPTAVMVHESNAARSLRDLWTSGMTIATEPGLPWVQLMNLKYGTDRVRIVPGTGGVASFMADPKLAQSVFITSEPVTMKLNNIPVRVISVAESGYDPYVAVYATRGPFLAAHRDALTKFAIALQQGWAAYLATPERFNPLIAPLNPAMNLAAMNEAATIMEPYVRTPGLDSPPLGSMDPARWESVEKQLVTTGILKNSVDWRKAFANLVAEPRSGASESPSP